MTAVPLPPDRSARLALLARRAAELAGRQQAPNTRRAYRADWARFVAWCTELGLSALPAAPQTLAMYLVDQPDRLAAASLERQLAAIADAHKAAGIPSPTSDPGLRATWRSIRRAKGTAQVGKAALLVDEIKAVLSALPNTAAGTRDRALLLVGFAGAFRRSELVALDVTDVEITDAGATVTIRRSKTDQAGAGQQVGIPRGQHPESCPVAALTGWLEVAGIERGPIFRTVDRHGRIRSSRLSGRDVARIVKRRAQDAGLDPKRYAGHSLRAGLATSATLAGAAEADVMRQLRHRSPAVTRRYVRSASLFTKNAAGQVGL